jgi:predicted HicB family RNase H-like nuclease
MRHLNYDKRINIRMRKSLYEKLELLAQSKNVSVAVLIREILNKEF